MKKTCVMILSIFFCASMAFGDEVDEGLPNIASQQIKASTRQMIRSGINRDEAIKITRLMLENHFRSEQVLRGHEIIMNAKREGLPEEPIMSKAFEGMAKHIEDRNVVRAMETVRSRYALAFENAKRITEERAYRHQIRNTIANCFAAGMNEGDVDAIMQALQQRARMQQMTQAQMGELATEAFRAARDMARLGVSSKAAADVVYQALRHRYSAREMKMMRKSFMTHSKYSAPNSLAESYSHAIQRGRSAGSIAASGMAGAGGPGSPGGSGHGRGPGDGGGGHH